MKSTIYKKKDGTISTIKNQSPDQTFTYSYSPSGTLKGSSIRNGIFTTFYDATYNPRRYGIKINNRSSYFSSKWKQYK